MSPPPTLFGAADWKRSSGNGLGIYGGGRQRPGRSQPRSARALSRTFPPARSRHGSVGSPQERAQEEKSLVCPPPPPTGVCSCSEGSIRLQAASSGLAQGGASLLEPRISLCQAKARLPLVAQRSALLLLPAPRRAAPAPLLSPRHSRQLPEPHQPLRTAQPRLRPVLCRPPRARDRCRAWDTAEGTQSGPNSLETPTSRLPPPPSWSVTGVRIVGNHSLIG